MPTLIAGAVAVFVLYSLLQMFRAANPAVLARAVKIVGGIVAKVRDHLGHVLSHGKLAQRELDDLAERRRRFGIV